MNTNNILTPEVIANDFSLLFKVPLYQRLFTWSAKEVKGLLDDLQYHFSKNATKPRPYYLGVVTTIEEKGKRCLIDGQQRFTVLMLMATVFSKFSSDWNKFFNQGQRLELFAREDDAAYLSYLHDLKIGNDSAVCNKYTNNLMRLAYETIRNYVYDSESKSERDFCNDFIQRSFKEITFFNSVLPKEYLSTPSSLNKYFEVMNSAGVNLEQHEVLKVLLLKDQPNQNELLAIWNLCSDFSRPLIKKDEKVGLQEYSDNYVSIYRKAKENINDAIQTLVAPRMQSESINRDFPTIAAIDIEFQNFDNPGFDEKERSVLTFPEFLLLVLDLVCRAEGQPISDAEFYKPEKLISRFQEYLPYNKVKDFYHALLKYRIALDLFIIRKKRDGQESEYSLVLRENGKQFEHECLTQFEGMISVTPTPDYKWVKMLFRHLDSVKHTSSPKDILLLLKNWDNSQHSMPENVNALSYNNVDRYWFWRLDYYLWERIATPVSLTEREDKEEEEKEEDDFYGLLKYKESVKEYIFRTNRSIEHLHPQDESNNEKWNPEKIDAFGNLAMISQGFNSHQSNLDVHDKFSRIETHIRNKKLQSIKLLAMYIKAKQTSAEWTMKASEEHQKEMFDFLVSTFPNE